MQTSKQFARVHGHETLKRLALLLQPGRRSLRCWAHKRMRQHEQRKQTQKRQQQQYSEALQQVCACNAEAAVIMRCVERITSCTQPLQNALPTQNFKAAEDPGVLVYDTRQSVPPGQQAEEV
jgi:hypothetical protein